VPAASAAPAAPAAPAALGSGGGPGGTEGGGADSGPVKPVHAPPVIAYNEGVRAPANRAKDPAVIRGNVPKKLAVVPRAEPQRKLH
jgi:hypothetical protein